MTPLTIAAICVVVIIFALCFTLYACARVGGEHDDAMEYEPPADESPWGEPWGNHAAKEDRK